MKSLVKWMVIDQHFPNKKQQLYLRKKSRILCLQASWRSFDLPRILVKTQASIIKHFALSSGRLSKVTKMIDGDVVDAFS